MIIGMTINYFYWHGAQKGAGAWGGGNAFNACWGAIHSIGTPSTCDSQLPPHISVKGPHVTMTKLYIWPNAHRK